jgi:hypothetical protein
VVAWKGPRSALPRGDRPHEAVWDDAQPAVVGGGARGPGVATASSGPAAAAAAAVALAGMEPPQVKAKLKAKLRVLGGLPTHGGAAELTARLAEHGDGWTVEVKDEKQPAGQSGAVGKRKREMDHVEPELAHTWIII